MTDVPENQGKMTPEEKLFRVIASGSQEINEATRFEMPPPKISSWDRFKRHLEKAFRVTAQTVSQISDSLVRLFHWARIFLNPKSEKFPLKTLNRGVSILLVLLAFYLLADIFLFRHQQVHVMPPVQTAYLPQATQTSTPSLAFYLTPVLDHNVFVPGSGNNSAASAQPIAVAATPAVIQATAPASAAESEAKASDFPFHLVGISWDAKEYVAMVEGEGTRGARFVRKGDPLPGGVSVKEVKEFSVLLMRGKQTWELS